MMANALAINARALLCLMNNEEMSDEFRELMVHVCNQVTQIADLGRLVADLADDDPCTWSQEGLDDGCFFCGGYIFHEGMNRVADHDPECPWVAARVYMGYSIAPHTIRVPKPEPAPVKRLHDPLIGY